MLNRIEPVGPPQAYKTYGFSMPVGTHFRPATCEEVFCLPYLNGWKTVVPVGSENEATVRTLLRSYSFTEESAGDGLVAFTFPAGQKCFKASTHRVPLGRPATFYVAGGDWRGNPERVRTRVHQRAEDWVEDFSIHADKIATAQKRG